MSDFLLETGVTIYTHGCFDQTKPADICIITSSCWNLFLGEVEMGQVVCKRQRDSETGDGEINFCDDTGRT